MIDRRRVKLKDLTQALIRIHEEADSEWVTVQDYQEGNGILLTYSDRKNNDRSIRVFEAARNITIEEIGVTKLYGNSSIDALVESERTSGKS